MQALTATPPRPVSDSTGEVSNALRNATHVFVRHDAVRKPLQPPYDGPFKVINHTDNHFTVDINGRKDTITLGRLKPAYFESCSDVVASSPPPVSTSTPTPLQPITETGDVSTPVRTTRSGRRVHWPTHLADYFAH